MGKDVIIACDFASAEETFKFLDNFTEEKPYVKIGRWEMPSIITRSRESFPATGW